MFRVQKHTLYRSKKSNRISKKYSPLAWIFSWDVLDICEAFDPNAYDRILLPILKNQNVNNKYNHQ